MEGLKLKYFVVNPESSDPVHAEASRLAMEAYADYIKFANPQYASDLVTASYKARAAEMQRNVEKSKGKTGASPAKPNVEHHPV